jgi:tetratricopeptide (TPR) repeat protein
MPQIISDRIDTDFLIRKKNYILKIEKEFTEEEYLKFDFLNADYLYGNKEIKQASKYYFNKEIEKLNEKKITNSNFINHNDSGHRVSSIFMICTYLYVVEKYETIITLFEEKTNESSDILGYWAELNYNQLKVYYAYALYKMGRTFQAKVVFDEIKRNRFDLNFKERISKIYAELKEVF